MYGNYKYILFRRNTSSSSSLATCFRAFNNSLTVIAIFGQTFFYALIIPPHSTVFMHRIKDDG